MFSNNSDTVNEYTTEVQSQESLQAKEQQARNFAYQNEIKRQRRNCLRSLTVVEAFKLAFSKRNIMLKGRASRSEFWQILWPIFLLYGIYTISTFLIALIFSYNNLSLVIVISSLSYLFYPLFFVLSCVATRRFKDINWKIPFFWGFFPFFISLIPNIILLFNFNEELFSYEDLYFFTSLISLCKYLPILLLIPLSFEGTIGANNYGVDPLEIRIYEEDLALYEQQKQLYELHLKNMQIRQELALAEAKHTD